MKVKVQKQRKVEVKAKCKILNLMQGLWFQEEIKNIGHLKHFSLFTK